MSWWDRLKQQTADIADKVKETVKETVEDVQNITESAINKGEETVILKTCFSVMRTRRAPLLLLRPPNLRPK